MEGAKRIPGANMYEQGQGKLDLLASRVSPLQLLQTLREECHHHHHKSSCIACKPCGPNARELGGEAHPDLQHLACGSTACTFDVHHEEGGGRVKLRHPAPPS